MLSPEAFKTCLMRSRKYPGQTVDPAVYSKYYLLLEKTYKLYTDYQPKQEDQIIERKTLPPNAKRLVAGAKALELEEERQYRLCLEESRRISKTTLFWIKENVQN